MKIIRKIITVILILIFCIVGIKVYENAQYQNEARPLIDRIDDYFIKNNTLPDSINDIDVECVMENGPYYEKINNSEYIVYFCVGFDEYYVYRSHGREWKYLNSIK